MSGRDRTAKRSLTEVNLNTMRRYDPDYSGTTDARVCKASSIDRSLSPYFNKEAFFFQCLIRSLIFGTDQKYFTLNSISNIYEIS